ncbi:MAG: phage major capsid protein [Candidatus Binatia bacterium]
MSHLDSREAGEISAMTIDYRNQDVVDGFFDSNALAARLLQRDNVRIDGADKIQQPIIFNRLIGGSYNDLDTFNTNRRRVVMYGLFDWKQYYVDLTISGLDNLKNSGAAKLIDHTNTLMDIAKLSGPDYVGDDMYLDGTGNSNKAISGLRLALDDGSTYTTYGGITRASTDAAGSEGFAVSGQVDTTGGTFTLGLMNQRQQDAVVSREKPDLIMTTQTIWNLWWDRVQPSQRFNAGDERNNMASVGFDTIVFNGADIVVDAKVPSGQVFFLNTRWMKMIIHTNRMWNFTGWKHPTHQDSMIGQLLWAGELVVQQPRLCSFVSNIS